MIGFSFTSEIDFSETFSRRIIGSKVCDGKPHTKEDQLIEELPENEAPEVEEKSGKRYNNRARLCYFPCRILVFH